MATWKTIVLCLMGWGLTVVLGRSISEIYGKLCETVEALHGIRFALDDLNNSTKQLLELVTNVTRRNF